MKAYLPRQSLSGLKEAAMLIKRTQQRPESASPWICRGSPVRANRRSRPPHVPASVRSCRRRSRRAGHAADWQRPEGRSRGRRAAHLGSHRSQEHLHALLGRMHGDSGSAEWGMDRTGAKLGFPDQSRIALREGRFGARARAQRTPAALSDEARQRAVDARLLGHCDQRDRRQAAWRSARNPAAIPSTGSDRPR